MLQKILGAIVGVVVSVVVVMVWQAITHMIDPPPSDLKMSDPEAMRAYMESLPAWKLGAVIPGYGLGAFVGGWMAALVARGHGWHAWVPTGLLLVGTFANVYSLPHPIWFPAVAILTILAGGWLSGRVGPKPA